MRDRVAAPVLPDSHAGAESLPARNRVLTPPGGARATTEVMTVTPINGWINWYRFARRTLGLERDEAIAYANLRYVEETNRAQLRGSAA